ncbi:hypothetical protein AMELA_G00137910 [Ameiurus melas]|uniref:Uncharacterized protein n=1 Tax=Ameiurus melas TaxID=219545 RepID=A0A7J6AK08_AMEME|nr:hypothetical protein AMELA_G00137910 [Ameiurus melas]
MEILRVCFHSAFSSGLLECRAAIREVDPHTKHQGHGESGAYPRNHRAQGGVHPGQGASPSQGTITYTFTHPHSYTTDTLDTPISLPCRSIYLGRKPEYLEETPTARGEHANSAHTGPRWELNPHPWRCEANVLTIKPNLFSFLLFFWSVSWFPQG